MERSENAASVIMAAGRGSRMKNYDGNKTLLPLIPEAAVHIGREPILVHIIKNLPPGPKAAVVNHRESDVVAATRSFGLTYCRQPELNGTGGALLAARNFLEHQDAAHVIITMGDVPFVSAGTYAGMIDRLETAGMIVLGFCPEDRKQYGVLEIENGSVARITEWKYWKDYPAEKQAALTVCNSGIYAARRDLLVNYLPTLAARPQQVKKQVNGEWRELEEFFLTDVAEYMTEDGLSVGYMTVDEPDDLMGVDDMDGLQKAQAVYRKKYG